MVVDKNKIRTKKNIVEGGEKINKIKTLVVLKSVNPIAKLVSKW